MTAQWPPPPSPQFTVRPGRLSRDNSASSLSRWPAGSHGVVLSHQSNPERVRGTNGDMLQTRWLRVQQDCVLPPALQHGKTGDPQGHVPREEHVHSGQFGDDARGVT